MDLRIDFLVNQTNTAKLSHVIFPYKRAFFFGEKLYTHLDSHYCPPAKKKSIGLQESTSYPRGLIVSQLERTLAVSRQSTNVDLE